MAVYKIKDLSFTYPESTEKTLDGISLDVYEGEFLCICGQSGCGKTTLLRMMKPVLSPYGERSGEIMFGNKKITDITDSEGASRIGFVMQDIESQTVTDKVWHELAFGLESLGVPNPEIRTRVSEMAEFFGISGWFYRDVATLSGGEKQLLNLASVMVMMPEVLILDEPTSQLDPIAAMEFINIVSRINRELGTTVIISEHRLEGVFGIADRVAVMDTGRIISIGTPKEVGKALCDTHHPMSVALPTPVRVYTSVSDGDNVPITVRDGRRWLGSVAEKTSVPIREYTEKTDTAIKLKDVYFRHEKDSPDIIKGMTAEVGKGELYAIVGGNGVGKSTMLSLISGVNKPYRGKVKVSGKVYALPQNPQLILGGGILGEYDSFWELENIRNRHPEDLSGGEAERVALAKVMDSDADIILLDEPTKGLDGHFKIKLAKKLKELTQRGITVVMVSHDIEFVAEYADRCSMFFDGTLTATLTPQAMFSQNSFYTTATARMSRGIIENAVIMEDIVNYCLA